MRNRTVDIAKGLGLVLVFVGHAIQMVPDHYAQSLFAWIYSFHMPLFFMLSGAVMAPTLRDWMPVTSLLKRTTQRLVFPYLAFGTAYLVVFFIQRVGLPYLPTSNGMTIFGYQWVQLLMGNPAPGIVIWFLYATAAVRISLWFIAPFLRVMGIPTTALGVLALWVSLSPTVPTMAYTSTSYLAPLSILGFAAFTLLGAALHELHTNVRPGWAMIATLAVVTAAMAQPTVPFFALGRFGSPHLLLLTALAGSAFVVALASRLGNTWFADAMADMGRRSLGIFCLNGFALGFLNGATSEYLQGMLSARGIFAVMLAFGMLQLVAAWTLVEVFDRVRGKRKPPVESVDSIETMPVLLGAPNAVARIAGE